VKTPPCPDRPSSSRPVDDRNPRSVFQSFKNLLIPASCSLCPNAPESGKTGIFTGLIQLCRPCHEDFQIPTGNCPGCLHQGDPIASRCHLCRRRTLEKPLVHLGAHSGSLRRWILLAKHGNRSDLTRSLGRALSRQFVDSKLVEEISTKSFGVSPIVVSIPRNRFRALLKGQPLAKFLGEILATESNLAFRKFASAKTLSSAIAQVSVATQDDAYRSISDTRKILQLRNTTGGSASCDSGG